MPGRIPSNVLCIVILCWSGSVWGQEPAKSSLSGKVTSSSPGGFSLKLEALEKDPLALHDGYSTKAAADGNFQFNDIDPGKYFLVAEGLGFLPAKYGADGPEQAGAFIELKPGQHRKGIVINLTPKRVVCGKVTDEHGAPLPKVEVYAFAHPRGAMWLAGGTYTVTDEEGNYRLPNLAPGEYFLEAGMSTWFSTSESLTQIQTESLANAEAVEVGPDNGAGCRENIRMGPRLGYRGFHVRGKISDAPALAGKNLVLSLLEVNPTSAARVFPPTEIIHPEHSFELWAAPAGRYRLILSEGRYPPNGFTGQPAFLILSSQEINVAAEDVNGITVAPDPLASLSGEVKLSEMTASVACPTRERAYLRIQKEDDGQFQTVQIAADGKFSLPQIPLGTYSVRLYPFLRGSVYVKSMLFDGQPVEGRKIRISSAAPHSLEVNLSGDISHASGHIAPEEPLERYQAEGTHPKASVSGTVTNTIAGNAPWIKLWAVRFNSNHSYEYSTKPGPNGAFRFENVDPGIYLLLAQGPGYTLSEYGASHQGLEGTAITLSAGQHLKGVTLVAARRNPSVCGRVTDEDGRALSNVSVLASESPRGEISQGSTGNAGNSSRVAQSTSSIMVVSSGPPRVNTDSAGNFQFFDLRPGQYLLWTDFMVPTGQEWTRRWSYHPSSPNLDGAQPVSVGFEGDTGCKHNIQLRKSKTFHVRGKLPQNLARANEEYFDIELAETNAAGAEGVTQVTTLLAPGDVFDFANVNAGHHSIRVTGPYEKPREGAANFGGPCSVPRHLVAAGEAVVGEGDINDVTLEPIPPVVVTGEIRFENIPKEWRGLRVEAQVVTLSPVDEPFRLRGAQILGGRCPLQAQLTPEGKFAIADVTAGTYLVGVNLTGVQGDALFLKSIAQNGRPIQGRHLTLAAGQPANLTMVVSNDGGQVDVQVDRSGPPAEEYRFEEPCGPKMTVSPEVWLIPDPLPADNSGIVTGQFTTAGYVQIYRVPPGRYHAIAGENFNSFFHFTLWPGESSVWTDPEFLRSASALGAMVEVAAGQKIKLELPDATAQLQDLLAKYEEEVRISDHCATSCSHDVFWFGEETPPTGKP